MQLLNIAGSLRENLFNIIYSDHVDCNSPAASLLNTRCLVRRAVDINRTKELLENKIMYLTENQITNDTDGAEHFEELSTFKVCFNSCAARHQNLAFFLDQNIVLLKHEAFPDISIIDIKKDSFSHDIIRVMLHCRSTNSISLHSIIH